MCYFSTSVQLNGFNNFTGWVRCVIFFTSVQRICSSLHFVIFQWLTRLSFVIFLPVCSTFYRWSVVIFLPFFLQSKVCNWAGWLIQFFFFFLLTLRKYFCQHWGTLAAGIERVLLPALRNSCCRHWGTLAVGIEGLLLPAFTESCCRHLGSLAAGIEELFLSALSDSCCWHCL